MPHLPFELRYDLTRRQRLVPHLRIWRNHGILATLSVTGAAAGIGRSWWFLGLVLFLLLIFRGFFIGLLNVLFVRRQEMDIVVEQNGLGFLVGKERWYFFLDGLTGFDQLMPGIWTIRHWNGSVVHVPAALLNNEQVEFFRSWVEKADAIRKELGVDGTKKHPAGNGASWAMCLPMWSLAMSNEQPSPDVPRARWWHHGCTSGFRAVAFGIIILGGVLFIGSALSVISFATGHKEPMGLIRLIFLIGEFTYGLPVCWLRPPYTPWKNALEIIIVIVFWGILAEMAFAFLLRDRFPDNRRRGRI